MKIDKADIAITTFRSGAGGQVVHSAERIVRATHIPTGIVVESGDEPTQLRNREKALEELQKKVDDYWDWIENHPGSPFKRKDNGHNGDTE